MCEFRLEFLSYLKKKKRKKEKEKEEEEEKEEESGITNRQSLSVSILLST